MKIIFKNMDPSDHAKNVIRERFSPLIEKFSALKSHAITFTMEMENSRTQAGPDHFNASALISGKVYKLRIKRSSQNLYQAIADLVESFNEIVGREKSRLQEHHS